MFIVKYRVSNVAPWVQHNSIIFKNRMDAFDFALSQGAQVIVTKPAGRQRDEITKAG